MSVRAVCDVCEAEGYREDTRRAAHALLAVRFTDLCRTDRWGECRWATGEDNQQGRHAGRQTYWQVDMQESRQAGRQAGRQS